MDPTSAKGSMAITDLPADILYCIFPYLDATEFLSFTHCSRTFLSYRADPAFWHALTRKTFRIPEQPLLQGERWQWLYKKLLTQTRLYTWGDNKSENLGHGRTVSIELHGLDGSTPSMVQTPRRTGWPREPLMDLDVGIISDVQCGGWSTTLLTSIGVVYMFGIFDGLSSRNRGSSSLRQLKFPPAYSPTTKDRYEPSTAIRQFSTGRSIVSGLSDDGKVWSWTQDTAVLIKSVHVDMKEDNVTRVEAGWDRSSMYVKDTGIVYWAADFDSDMLPGARQEPLEVADTLLIETVTIPGTGYRQKRNSRDTDESLEARIGEVLHYIVLEAHIVFTTHLNKIFSYSTTFPMPALDKPDPVELTTFYNSPFEIRDLQGSFSHFAVFTKSGAILTANCPLLDTFHRISQQTDPHSSSETDLPIPNLLPALQIPGIISLSFGDHHLHALHRNGTLTSYGTECQRCGALGLGDRHQSPYRGVLATRGPLGDGHIPAGQTRTVWFEPLMETWLQDMCEKAAVGEAKPRGDLIQASNAEACKASGDFFEKEGRKWIVDPATAEEGEDEMGAYFALKVASAGWHSAALVLVDEEKANRVRDRFIVSRPPAAATLTPTASPNASAGASTDSFEYIDSPSEQLANAVIGIFTWCRNLARRFLGLTARDERAAALAEANVGENAFGRRGYRRGVGSLGGGGRRERDVKFVWDEEPFPRLRLEGGGTMPGEVARWGDHAR